MRLVRSHGFVEAEQYLAAWRVIRGLPWTTDGSTRCSRHLRPVRGIDRFHDIQWHSACRMCQSPHFEGVPMLREVVGSAKRCTYVVVCPKAQLHGWPVAWGGTHLLCPRT